MPPALLHEQQVEGLFEQRLHAGPLLRGQDLEMLGDVRREMPADQTLAGPGRAAVNRSFFTDISEDISFFWSTAVAYAFIAVVNTFAGECAPPCFISASFRRITLCGIFAATRA
jgi:hypothetical protein